MKRLLLLPVLVVLLSFTAISPGKFTDPTRTEKVVKSFAPNVLEFSVELTSPYNPETDVEYMGFDAHWAPGSLNPDPNILVTISVTLRQFHNIAYYNGDITMTYYYTDAWGTVWYTATHNDLFPRGNIISYRYSNVIPIM